MASSWQRPPDTGCDADGIPHGFRKVMGDMAAEMGDDELMRASQGSIHDPRHTSKTFSDIHQKFFGAAKKAGHMALAAQGFREAGERRVMRGVDAHGNSMDYSGGKYARGAKLMLSARAGGPPQWDPRPQHIRQEYRETRELRKEGFETRQERDAAVRSQWGLEGDRRNQFQRVMVHKQDRYGNSYGQPKEHGPGIRDRYGNDADYSGGRYARGAQASGFGGGDGLPAPLTPRGGQGRVPQDQGMLSVANAQAVEVPRPADWDARRRRDYAAGRHPLPQGDGPHWHPFHQSQSEVDRKFLQHVWRKSRNQ